MSLVPAPRQRAGLGVLAGLVAAALLLALVAASCLRPGSAARLDVDARPLQTWTIEGPGAARPG